MLKLQYQLILFFQLADACGRFREPVAFFLHDLGWRLAGKIGIVEFRFEPLLFAAQAGQFLFQPCRFCLWIDQVGEMNVAVTLAT